MFLDSVTVTNAHTVIDTDAMTRTVFHLDDIAQRLTHIAQRYAVPQTRTSFTGMSYQCARAIELQKDLIHSLHEQCTHLSQNIGRSALIFLSAEGKSAQFFALRARIFPSYLAQLDFYVESTPFSVLTPMSYRIPRTIADFIPFATGKISDPVDAQTTQLHLEALSAQILQRLHLEHIDRIPMSNGSTLSEHYRTSRGSWWHADPCETITAASIMSAAFFAYGKLRYGSTVAAQGIGTVPDVNGGEEAVRINVPTTTMAHTFIQPMYARSPLTQALFQGLTMTTIPSILPARHLKAEDTHRLARRPTPPHPTPTPVNPSEAIKRIGNLAESQEYGQFEILKHETPTPDGQHKRSWSILIRGTQKWDGGGSNPQDMLTNFQGVAREESDQTRLIKAAMKNVGIAPDEPVELIGHSQGGIIAAQLGADPDINAHYTVADILTAGAPTGGYDPHTRIGMLNLENTRDLVPALEGRANSDQSYSSTVYFDGKTLDLHDKEGRPRFAHDISVYATAMNLLENSADQRANTIVQWSHERNEIMGFTQSTRTRSYIFDTSRIHTN